MSAGDGMSGAGGYGAPERDHSDKQAKGGQLGGGA